MVPALAFIPGVYLLRNLWLLSSDLQLLLRLSVLSSWSSLLTNHASSTRSKQATQIDKQTITTKNKHQSKEKLRKSALNDTAYCYDRDNARTIKNGAIVKRTRLSRLEV